MIRQFMLTFLSIMISTKPILQVFSYNLLIYKYLRLHMYVVSPMVGLLFSTRLIREF